MHQSPKREATGYPFSRQYMWFVSFLSNSLPFSLNIRTPISMGNYSIEQRFWNMVTKTTCAHQDLFVRPPSTYKTNKCFPCWKPLFSIETNFLFLSLSLSLSMALQSFGPWPLFLFRFVILYTVGRTPWTGDQPIARPLPTNRTTQTQNKRTQTSMPRVGYEPTIPMFERMKTVHALDCAAALIGTSFFLFRVNSLTVIKRCPGSVLRGCNPPDSFFEEQVAQQIYDRKSLVGSSIHCGGRVSTAHPPPH
jgi:hypothetical protein